MGSGSSARLTGGAMKADLHLHTWYSDGAESPRRVVELAARAGLGLIAIADHDSMGAYGEACEAGREHDVRVLPAAEFTAVLGGEEVHLLGYFAEPPGEPVVAHLRCVQEFRRLRLEQAVARLRERGYSITMEALPSADCCESLTSAHLARMLVEQGIAHSMRAVWRRGAVRNALCDFEGRSCDVIEVIHAGKGLAVWAHPPQRRFARRLEDLVADGLDGVEIHNFRRDGSHAEKMLEQAEAGGLVVTGGSDWHQGPGLGDRFIEGAILDRFLERLEARGAA